MVSSYSFRTCWAGKGDRLGIVQEWEVEAIMGRKILFAAYLAGVLGSAFLLHSFIKLSILCFC